MKITTIKKAESLYTKGHVKLMAKGQILKFIVKGTTNNYEIHCNRNTKQWSCTCKWFSLKQTYCSHIHSCLLLLQYESEGIGL